MPSLNAALLLFARLTAKLTHYNQHFLEVLMLSLTIMLFSLSKFDQSSPDENKDIVKNVLNKAIVVLKDWITNQDVIGGSLFGGRVVGGRLVHSENELQVNGFIMLGYRLKVKPADLYTTNEKCIHCVTFAFL